jgi:RHS repeat-associated protein
VRFIALQSDGVKWVHHDPVLKSQRLADSTQSIMVELDPWGGETNRSWQQWQQPHRYTSYERDGSGNDQAMYRQYHSYWMRFDQPDPYDGSYNLTDPQSLNRYSYVQNDPVNFVGPGGFHDLLRLKIIFAMRPL